MNRQHRESTTTEVGRLRDKRPLSAETSKKTQEIADYWMELDARNAIGGKEHPSAAADLWMDETGQVHEGTF
jgi:hypothetical protein